MSIGNEKTPLLIMDNFVAEPGQLIDIAARMKFEPAGKFFPGIRAVAPMEYQRFLLDSLGPFFKDYFNIGRDRFKLTMCHYSLVTTPAEKLSVVQRIPHVDSFDGQGLASVHYLFKKGLGGTAFYRHRKTGFEVLNESRKPLYFQSLESENGGPDMPPPEYINGDTALFQQIARQEGVFNRIIVYPRNVLHSGCIDKNFVFDENPLTGRLSINSFID